MKYIKYFENVKPTRPTYWVVPTDERFIPTLREIGAPENFIKNLSSSSGSLVKGMWRNRVECPFPFIFISYGYSPSLSNARNCYEWGWSLCTEYSRSLYVDTNVTFGGNTSAYELDAEKYNL